MTHTAWRTAALLTLIGLAFSARSLVSSRQHIAPLYDEPSYLDVARDFAARGGTAIVIGDYFNGNVHEDKWHPLYLLALAPLMDNTPLDFTRAKLFSLFSLFLLMAVVFGFTQKLWGSSVGLLATALVGFSPAAMLLSHRVLSDIFFSIFYFATIYSLLRLELSWKTALLTGALAGCAYLSKGNGQFLLFSIMVAGCVRAGRVFFKTSFPYLSVAAFVFTAGFLLVRNVRIWGRPFYHLASRVFWLDAWQDYFILIDSPLWGRIGPVWYFSQHTLADAALRFWRGTAEMFSMLIYALSVGPSGRVANVVSGGLMFVVIGYGLFRFIREKWNLELAALGSTALLLFFAFAWGVAGMNSHWRYMFPVAMTLFPVAALTVWNAVMKKPRAVVWLETLIATGCVVLLIQNRSAFSISPLSLWSSAPFIAQTSHWIETKIPTEKYLIDYRSSFSAWTCCRDNRDPYPLSVSSALIENHMAIKNIQFILLDQWVNSPEQDSKKYGRRDEHGPVTFLGRPRCFADSSVPSALLIYGDTCP